MSKCRMFEGEGGRSVIVSQIVMKRSQKWTKQIQKGGIGCGPMGGGGYFLRTLSTPSARTQWIE